MNPRPSSAGIMNPSEPIPNGIIRFIAGIAKGNSHEYSTLGLKSVLVGGFHIHKHSPHPDRK